MEKKDLEQIQEVVEKAVKTGLGEFWEGNLEPALDEINDNQTIMQTKLDKALYMETERITKLENDMKVVKEKLGIR